MDSWVAIDFETANGSRASACSVALVRVSDGEVKETFETFIKPPAGFDHFDHWNTRVHGIQASDVADAPDWPTVWTAMRDFIDGAPLVAHNAAFDTSVIREANAATGLPWPTLRYACTLVLARQTWELKSYRLPEVARAAGVAFSDHHKAAADARAAADILLAQQLAHGVGTADALLKSARVRWGQIHPQGWDGCKRQ
jgi:DNA polymerase III subunit epsilon